MAETVSEATRERITVEAARLVRYEPVSTLSVARVAEAAGVTNSSIYKAYASKYELFAEASRRVMVDQVGEVAESVDEGASPEERLRQVVAGVLQVCSDEPFAVAYLYGLFPLLHHAEIDESVREEVALVDDEVRARLRHRVDAVMTGGALAGDPDDLVEECRLAVFGYLGEAVHGAHRLEPAAFADFVLRGLGVAEG